MKPGKTKIMVQIWGPLLKALTRDLRALHIRRDPYLNDLFRNEIGRLENEVDFRNSDEVVDRIISRRLPDRIKRTIELDGDLVTDLNRILGNKNIPRDTFINRVLFFLLAKESHLKALGIEYDYQSENGAKPLDEVKVFLLDPFWHIRSANDDRFYTIACFRDSEWGGFPNMFSLNTAISDDDWFLINHNMKDMLADLGITDKHDGVE